MVTVRVRAQGPAYSGVVHVWINGTLRNIIWADSYQDISIPLGDSFRFVALVSDTGAFEQWCDSLGCQDSSIYTYVVPRSTWATAIFYNKYCNRTVSVQQGFGSVKVYKNNILIGTVTSSQTFTGLTDTDILKLEAIPASGYIFQKFCDNLNVCVNGNPWQLGVTCSFGDRAYGAYFILESTAIDLTVKREQGSGKVNVYSDGGFIGYLSDTETSKTFSFQNGATFELDAYPYPPDGNMFEKWCDNNGCTTDHILTGTISSNISGGNTKKVYFTASHNVCEDDANTGTGICKNIPGIGMNECDILGNTCSVTEDPYHNECKSGLLGSICERIAGIGTNTCTIDQIGKSCTPVGGPGSCIIKNPLDGKCLLDFNTVIISIVVLIIILFLLSRIGK